MSVLTILFSMVSGVSLTIGAVHLIIWGGKSRRKAYLLSAVMALSAGAFALLELAVTQTDSAPVLNSLILWSNLLVAMVVLSMVWFVNYYMDSGRTWLAWLITGLWGAGLVVNFLFPGNLTFSEIQAVRPVETFWGEPYFHVEGAANPFKLLADIASLLILVFVVDASVTAGRRGAPRRALVIGGSITFFILVAGIHTPLVDAGVVTTPSLISVVFLAIIAAMSYEIAWDVLRARILSEKVRAGQELWQSLLDTIQMVVLTVDVQGKVNYANPFFLQLKGLTLEAVKNQRATDLLGAPELHQMQAQLGSSTGMGRPLETQINLLDQKGYSRILALSAMRLTGREGQFAGVLYVAADITQQVAAKRDLASTRLQLDRVMRSNLLGEFASSLAHELSQPLAAILANGEVLRRYLDHVPPKLDQAREVVEYIISDDRRAADLITNLRAMVHRGEMPLEVLDLREVLKETLKLVQREIRLQGIKLELDQPSNALLVRASRIEVQQVILNLMLNAMQAMTATSETEREIRVTAQRSGEEARIEIRDSGPGIPEGQVERLFDAFNTERVGNVGLGLSICRRIAEAHGGSVTAANGDPGGAVFSFFLPLQEQEKESV